MSSISFLENFAGFSFISLSFALSFLSLIKFSSSEAAIVLPHAVTLLLKTGLQNFEPRPRAGRPSARAALLLRFSPQLGRCERAQSGWKELQGELAEEPERKVCADA